MKEKVSDALWPFHPDNQPEGIVDDYLALCKKVGVKKQYEPVKSELTDLEGNRVQNPFNKPDNDELTFLGRNLYNPQAVKYRPENFELYGPLWIFVTLIVEFVILGHLTN